MNFRKFKEKSLRACALIMELVQKHEFITMQHFKSSTQVNNKLKSAFVQTVLKLDHNYANTAHSDEDMKTELDVHTVLKSDHNYAQIAHTDEIVKKELDKTVEAVTVKYEEKCKRLDSAVEDHTTHYMSYMNETVFNDNKTKEENFSDQSILLEAQLIDDAIYKALKKPAVAEEKIKIEDPIKYENVTYECTLCSKEFVNEQEYQVHMGAHLQLQLIRCHTKEQHAQLSSPLSDKIVDMTPNLRTKYRDRKLHSNTEIDVVVTKSPSPVELTKNEVHPTDTVVQIDILAVEDKTILADLRKSQFTLLEPNESLAKIRKSINRFQKNQNQFQNYTHEKIFTCEICNYTCKNNGKLVRHMRSHNSEKSFACELCNYNCKSKRRLEYHMRSHTSEKSFAYELCNYKYKTNGRLLNHMRTHSGQKAFTCEICNYKFRTNRKLVYHMRSHTSENIFACELCTFKCKRNSILVNHNKRVHTGKKPFACELCNYKCKTSYCLVNHVRTHSGEKPFACELCNFKSTENSNLIRHMRTHTGVKPFVCDICNHKFSVKCNLLNHMRTHTGEKPFACELCKFKCKEKSGLIRHMKTHTNVKPFSCKVCNYKCIRKSRLLAHMRIHTGEKPFACKLCPHKFVENWDLVKHMRTHNEVLVKVDVHSSTFIHFSF